MQSSRLLPLLLLLVLGSIACAQQHCWFAGPRVDCGFGVTADECQKKGCCWEPAEFEGAPHVDLPWCFYSNDDLSTYAIFSTGQGGDEPAIIRNSSGSGGNLDEAILELQQPTLPQLGADIQCLKASIKEISPGIVRFRLTDAQQQRWEVPSNLFPPKSFAGGGAPTSSNLKTDTLDVNWDVNPFSLRISNGSQSLFDSTGLRLVFKDQYIELSTHITPSASLYGGGERASDTLHLFRNGMPRVLWNQDKGPTFLEHNSYGSYPFVLALDSKENSGMAWGYFMLSSNGMEIIPTTDRLSWRIIGGMIDLFIFSGPTPAAVLEQLTKVVGRPALTPYWTLGWQQSKYGYKSIWEVEEVVAKYAENGIPLETIVTDIDYMDHWKDFAFDPQRYPLEEMQKFVANLEVNGQKWVPIVDPGIAVLPGYEPYDAGIKEDVFLKEYDGKTPYLGWCWPGPTHFIDFLPESGQRFLKNFLKSWYNKVPFSGVWIDMNEASNFCSGDMCKIVPKGLGGKRGDLAATTTKDDPPPWICQLDCTEDIRPRLNATMRSFLDPPFRLSSSLGRQNLGSRGLSVLSSHLGGALQYNTHNVYGLAECQATSNAVQEITGKRPFVLSRSSFTGVGSYAAHWSGDNSATWTDLKRSLIQIMSYGLQGIPMGGADTGFSGDITEELCARWFSLSAMAYPFARSHSDLHSIHQEPYLWPSVLQATKHSLNMRYKLLSYHYTLHRISRENGMPVMRPLWLNYPQDGRTHQIDRQVMLGEAFLVTPALEQGVEKVQGYFPAGTVWYDMFEESASIDTRSGAKEVEVPACIGTIPVPLHMAGGNIVATHTIEQHAGSSLVTAQVRRSPLTLVVALKHPVVVASSGAEIDTEESQTASGFMFLDDGESIHALDAAADCNFLKFSARVVQEKFGLKIAKGELNISFGVPNGFEVSGDVEDEGLAASCQGFEWPELATVKILGWEKQVAKASLAVEGASTDLQWSNLSKRLELTIPEGFRSFERPLKQQLALTWSSAAADSVLLRGKLQKEQLLAAEY